LQQETERALQKGYLIMTLEQRVKELRGVLHEMPEVAFKEFKTSAYVAQQLRAAGYAVQTGIGVTGVVGVLDSGKPGPVLALRADMDALRHVVNGKEYVVHSCGHDAHMATMLTVAEEIARCGIKQGRMKVMFQPAEETLSGALFLVKAGVLDDVDVVLGMHLRPIQEARNGQAGSALYHGGGYVLDATIDGLAAHGARPHLGINCAEASSSIVQAINAIHLDPLVPYSVKVTRIQVGGGPPNIIPDKGEMTFDLRAQQDASMDLLIEKTKQAIESGAAAVGARAAVSVRYGAPAAQYSKEIMELAEEAIVATLGREAFVGSISTTGTEDFHYFVKHKPSLKAGYIALGCDLTPGTHHPAMTFNTDALVHGVNILLYMTRKIVSVN
jgi:amidohydrolase